LQTNLIVTTGFHRPKKSLPVTTYSQISAALARVLRYSSIKGQPTQCSSCIYG